MTDEKSYFYRRAEAELEQAQRAADPRAVRAHSRLAEAYLERANLPKNDEANESQTA